MRPMVIIALATLLPLTALANSAEPAPLPTANPAIQTDASDLASGTGTTSPPPRHKTTGAEFYSHKLHGRHVKGIASQNHRILTAAGPKPEKVRMTTAIKMRRDQKLKSNRLGVD